MSSYSNRQEFELDTWPELRDKLQELKNLAWTIQCAVPRCHTSVGETPTRQGSFQPVAVETVAQELQLKSFSM